MGLGNLAPVICLKWIEPSNYPSFSLKLYVTLFENIKPADVHRRDFRCIYATYNSVWESRILNAVTALWRSTQDISRTWNKNSIGSELSCKVAKRSRLLTSITTSSGWKTERQTAFQCNILLYDHGTAGALTRLSLLTKNVSDWVYHDVNNQHISIWLIYVCKV